MQSQYLAQVLRDPSMAPAPQQPSPQIGGSAGLASLAAMASRMKGAQPGQPQPGTFQPPSPDSGLPATPMSQAPAPAAPHGWGASPLGRAVMGQPPAAGQAPYQFGGPLPGQMLGGARKGLHGLFDLGQFAKNGQMTSQF